MGDVIEGADRFIISLAGAEWFGNIAGQGGGGRSGQIGDYIFTMDAPVNRNTLVEYDVYLFTVRVEACK